MDNRNSSGAIWKSHESSYPSTKINEVLSVMILLNVILIPQKGRGNLWSQGLGVNVYLAGWGYCTEEQKNSAKKREDITFLTEENIYLVLDEALG